MQRKRLDLNKSDSLLKSVIEIDEVEYLLTEGTIKALEEGKKLIPIKRIIDKNDFYVARDKLTDSEIIDEL